jgi:hypothetical protein
MDLPLEILDRDVARAAGALASGHARLARGETDDAPSPLEAHRHVSSRATWLELGELGEATGAVTPRPAPVLAAPLRAWVSALTLERVLWPDAVRLAAAWRAPTINVEESGVTALTDSPRALLLRVLREPDAGRRRIFARALARGATPVHDAARALAERRVEAARLLGAALDPLEIPVDPPAALGALAARLLAETAPLLDRASTWPDAIAAGVGRSFGEGWPARLTPRWLFDLFGAGPLTEGLRLALDPLPAAIGASSFARALGAFGAALADADGPTPGDPGRGRSGSPFVLTRAPFDLRRPRRAALFAALAADPIFAARALGLGRGRARDQARGITRALLVTLRLDAARVLCRGILTLPEGERAARFEEHTAAALGAPLPPSLAGVVPRLGPADSARFAGALLAARDRRSLVDRFDEDWFASPHAARAIREEDAAVPSSTLPATLAPAAALEAGLAEITRVLGEIA